MLRILIYEFRQTNLDMRFCSHKILLSYKYINTIVISLKIFCENKTKASKYLNLTNGYISVWMPTVNPDFPIFSLWDETLKFSLQKTKYGSSCWLLQTTDIFRVSHSCDRSAHRTLFFCWRPKNKTLTIKYLSKVVYLITCVTNVDF